MAYKSIPFLELHFNSYLFDHAKQIYILFYAGEIGFYRRWYEYTSAPVAVLIRHTPSKAVIGVDSHWQGRAIV